MARAKSKGTLAFDGGIRLMSSKPKWEDKPYVGWFGPTILGEGKGEDLLGFQTSREEIPGETWSHEADLSEVVKTMVSLAEEYQTQIYDRAIRGLEHFGPKCELALKCKFYKKKPYAYIQISPAPVEIKAPAKVKVKAPAKAPAKATGFLKIPTKR